LRVALNVSSATLPNLEVEVEAVEKSMVVVLAGLEVTETGVVMITMMVAETAVTILIKENVYSELFPDKS
jgi:hypothetical protein